MTCMAHEPTHRRPEVHAISKSDGGRRLLLGRNSEICLCQPGHRTLYETRHAVPAPHRRFRCVPGNRRWTADALRMADTADCLAVYFRDDRRDSFDQDLALPRHIASASARGSTKDWNVGGPARSALRIRATHDGCVFDDQRPGSMVIGCAAREATAGAYITLRSLAARRAARSLRTRRRWYSGSRAHIPGLKIGEGDRYS